MLARLSYYACPKDWINASSLKAHPEKNTVLRLTDEVIKDGFISAGEPLLIREIVSPNDISHLLDMNMVPWRA
eukprot:14488234-Alexandrium_andersonii.AAC.1